MLFFLIFIILIPSFEKERKGIFNFPFHNALQPRERNIFHISLIL